MPALNDVPSRWPFIEVLGKCSKESFCKELVVRDKEMVLPCDLVFESAAKGEEVVSLPSNFVKFSSSLGMPITGLEKEISLLMKLDSRKGKGVKGSGRKKNSFPFSRSEREL